MVLSLWERREEWEGRRDEKPLDPLTDFFFLQKTGDPEKNREVLYLIMIVESGTRQGNQAKERRGDVQSV